MLTFKWFKYPLTLMSFAVLSAAGQAQSISVIGGNEEAERCYNHANRAAMLNDGFISNRMLESCNFALEHIQLSRHDRAATFSNRGILHALDGDLEAALSDYQRALELEPESGEVFINRGNIYHRAGYFNQAIDDYTQALDYGVSQADVAYMLRGLAFQRQEMYERAEADFRRALEERPGWTRVQTLLERLQTRMEEDAAEET